MVGAALALALSQRDYSVVLLEPRPPAMQWDASSHDLRVSALTRASQHLLINLGVWDAMAADRVTAYRQMHVWDRAGLGEIQFDAADLGEPDLGHIVENRVIVRALWRALADTAVDIRAGRWIREQRCREDGVSLVLDDDSTIEAGLLIGADGARSAVREAAGIESRREDYEQHAVVATVRAEKGNQAAAWQRFMASGPLALLPMRDDLFSIVWSTSPAHAQQLLGLDEALFDEQLSETSEWRLGRLTLLAGRAAFPLMLQHAQRYTLPGLALVGDAAHVIHPLAGQGVNLGFLDAAALVDALLSGRARRRAVGSMMTLRPYERARKGHNTATQLAMDGFKHLFSNDAAPLSLLRNLGLGAADRITPLKRLFERVALGQGVELPTLSRPPRQRR